MGTEAPLASLAFRWPPSVNHEWIQVRGRTILSPAGRAYRTYARGRVMIARQQGLVPPEPLEGSLRAVLELAPPDGRRRDADNYAKALFDALTHAGFWRDDQQVKDLRSLMLGPAPGGRVRLTVWRLEGEPRA
jgi:crossover junction endodeoxyribonuclease RusA